MTSDIGSLDPAHNAGSRTGAAGDAAPPPRAPLIDGSITCLVGQAYPIRQLYSLPAGLPALPHSTNPAVGSFRYIRRFPNPDAGRQTSPPPIAEWTFRRWGCAPQRLTERVRPLTASFLGELPGGLIPRTICLVLSGLEVGSGGFLLPFFVSFRDPRLILWGVVFAFSSLHYHTRATRYPRCRPSPSMRGRSAPSPAMAPT